MTPIRTRRIVDEAGVDSVLLAAERHARAKGYRVVIAVVDRAGNVLALRRTPGAQVGSSAVAVDKARTAAIYRRPSKDFEDQASTGRPSALHLARAVPLQGGMPLLEGSHVIGAVGVSGASSADEDQELAVLGCEALSVKHPATYIPRDKVHAQFQTGGLLLEAPGYKLDAGRRTGPGEVELHDRETDIMQAVQGRATVVTGEDEHTLGVGDVLVIPSGMPHQFVHVTGPFLYFVTKVQS